MNKNLETIPVIFLVLCVFFTATAGTGVADGVDLSTGELQELDDNYYTFENSTDGYDYTFENSTCEYEGNFGEHCNDTLPCNFRRFLRCHANKCICKYPGDIHSDKHETCRSPAGGICYSFSGIETKACVSNADCISTEGLNHYKVCKCSNGFCPAEDGTCISSADPCPVESTTITPTTTEITTTTTRNNITTTTQSSSTGFTTEDSGSNASRDRFYEMPFLLLVICYSIFQTTIAIVY